MNFLAHLFLADVNGDSLVGQLLGDVVKGRALHAFEPEIRDAILFHRRIDAFSDAHAVTRASRDRIGPQRRKYAGVMVDVCYDHFLAQHWSHFSAEPLEAFSQRVYRRLASDRRRCAEAVRPLVNRMIAYDWLGGYRSLDNIAVVLDRVAGRLTRGDRFLGGIVDIKSNYRAFEKDFLTFFPELMDYSRAYLSACTVANERSQQHDVYLCNG